MIPIKGRGFINQGSTLRGFGEVSHRQVSGFFGFRGGHLEIYFVGLRASERLGVEELALRVWGI